MTEDDIIKLTWAEGGFVLLTIACAALDLWGLFAGMALLCLLAPMWIIVFILLKPHIEEGEE